MRMTPRLLATRRTSCKSPKQTAPKRWIPGRCRDRVEGAGVVREMEATLHRGARVVRLEGVELDFDIGR